jgi:hypothetical protein
MLSKFLPARFGHRWLRIALAGEGKAAYPSSNNSIWRIRDTSPNFCRAQQRKDGRADFWRQFWPGRDNFCHLQTERPTALWRCRWKGRFLAGAFFFGASGFGGRGWAFESYYRLGAGGGANGPAALFQLPRPHLGGQESKDIKCGYNPERIAESRDDHRPFRQPADGAADQVP